MPPSAVPYRRSPHGHAAAVLSPPLPPSPPAPHTVVNCTRRRRCRPPPESRRPVGVMPPAPPSRRRRGRSPPNRRCHPGRPGRSRAARRPPRRHRPGTESGVPTVAAVTAHTADVEPQTTCTAEPALFTGEQAGLAAVTALSAVPVDPVAAARAAGAGETQTGREPGDRQQPAVAAQAALTAETAVGAGRTAVPAVPAAADEPSPPCHRHHPPPVVVPVNAGAALPPLPNTGQTATRCRRRTRHRRHRRVDPLPAVARTAGAAPRTAYGEAIARRAGLRWVLAVPSPKRPELVGGGLMVALPSRAPVVITAAGLPVTSTCPTDACSRLPQPGQQAAAGARRSRRLRTTPAVGWTTREPTGGHRVADITGTDAAAGAASAVTKTTAATGAAATAPRCGVTGCAIAAAGRPLQIVGNACDETDSDAGTVSPAPTGAALTDGATEHLRATPESGDHHDGGPCLRRNPVRRERCVRPPRARVAGDRRPPAEDPLFLRG